MEQPNSFNHQHTLKNFKFGVDEQVKLVTSFFNSYNKERLNPYQSLVLDLYRAITCFRLYGTIDNFFAVNPELEPCREDIVELWTEFEGLKPEELADISIKLLEDI